jgi:hypothetical protein
MPEISRFLASVGRARRGFLRRNASFLYFSERDQKRCRGVNSLLPYIVKKCL